MSLRSNFIAIFMIAGSTLVFSSMGMAQDKTVTPQTKTDTLDKGDHVRGPGRFGKAGPGGRRGGPGMRAGGPGMMFRGLNLTDAQKTQIQEIMKSNRPNVSPESREEMRSLRMARRTGTLTTAQEDKLKSVRTEGQAKAKSVHDQIMNVLTTEQKATLEQRRTEMKDRMQQRGPLRGLKTPPPPKTN